MSCVRPKCYVEIRLKFLFDLDKNSDVILQDLVDKYNFWSLMGDSNMVERNKTRA